jgi:hypothetical protein
MNSERSVQGRATASASAARFNFSFRMPTRCGVTIYTRSSSLSNDRLALYFRSSFGRILERLVASSKTRKIAQNHANMLLHTGAFKMPAPYPCGMSRTCPLHCLSAFHEHRHAENPSYEMPQSMVVDAF